MNCKNTQNKFEDLLKKSLNSMPYAAPPENFNIKVLNTLGLKPKSVFLKFPFILLYSFAFLSTTILFAYIVGDIFFKYGIDKIVSSFIEKFNTTPKIFSEIVILLSKTMVFLKNLTTILSAYKTVLLSSFASTHILSAALLGCIALVFTALYINSDKLKKTGGLNVCT